MNQAMFSYLRQKLQKEFQESSWEDRIADSFEENELDRMTQSLKELETLEEEIIEFQKKIKGLIGSR